MPVVEIVRRGRGGRQEITFKRIADAPRPVRSQRSAPDRAIKQAAPVRAERSREQRPVVPIAISTQAAAALFSTECPAWDANLPLAIGVRRELNRLARPHGLSKRAVMLAVAAHCGSKEYLRRIAEEGAVRHSLDGEPVEPVSAEHSQIAQSQLAAME